MIRFDPTLFVKRLVIVRGDKAVYDEQFHLGVNIIRGENSSGKSTILNFIFYGLGGDLAEWSDVALLCSRVIVEVQLSGIVATLSREVSDQNGTPMEIFGGEYDAAMRAPKGEWIRYPYRRSQSRESFSQAIFRLLGIPEAANELSGNITIHQILRVLYADQLSPIDEIFRFESFDNGGLRDAIGRLLCGAYDNKLYENEQRIKILTREFDAAQAELRSMFAVLGRADQITTTDWLAGQREVIAQERRAIQSAIETAEQDVYAKSADDQITLAVQNQAYELVRQLQHDITTARKELDSLTLTIVDSNAFIRTLRSKIEALRDSSRVASNIGDVSFHLCPACYAALSTSDSPSQVCHLCKTPFDAERARTRIAGLINETAIQIKQSEVLQRTREDRAGSLADKLRSLEAEWGRASERLSAIQRLPSSETRDRLRELQRQSGYLERQAEELEQKARIAQLIDGLSQKKEALNAEMTRLKTENDALRARQQNRLTQAYTAIADEVRTLLHHDLRRQDSFETARSVNFTFADNRITVDGQSYFSASSRAILKSSFCLGFLAAAAKIPFFRHPRFCMIDILENMGVEMARSHNFQLQIARTSSELKSEHQIIYATAMIVPDLDEEGYTVGRSSMRDEPTLTIQG